MVGAFGVNVSEKLFQTSLHVLCCNSCFIVVFVYAVGFVYVIVFVLMLFLFFMFLLFMLFMLLLLFLMFSSKKKNRS